MTILTALGPPSHIYMGSNIDKIHRSRLRKGSSECARNLHPHHCLVHLGQTKEGKMVETKDNKNLAYNASTLTVASLANTNCDNNRTAYKNVGAMNSDSHKIFCNDVQNLLLGVISLWTNLKVLAV